MKIAIIAAGLALAGGLGAAAPAEAQYYGHHHGYYGHHHGFNGPHRGFYRHHGYGPRYGYQGYRHGRTVCTYRHGLRRCFRG